MAKKVKLFEVGGTWIAQCEKCDFECTGDEKVPTGQEAYAHYKTHSLDKNEARKIVNALIAVVLPPARVPKKPSKRTNPKGKARKTKAA